MCVCVCVCVCVGKAPLTLGGRLLYLVSWTVQPRSLLPLSSEERSAESGKSEAAAYFKKALEKVGQLTSSLFSLMPPGPLLGIEMSQNTAHFLKVSISNLWFLNLQNEICFPTASNVNMILCEIPLGFFLCFLNAEVCNERERERGRETTLMRKWEACLSPLHDFF